MDPIEVREERVATSADATPVVAAGEPVAEERGFPVHPGAPPDGPAPAFPVAAPPAAPVTTAPVKPVATAPVAPVTTAPLAPAVGTSVYSSRVGVYPVGYRTIQLIWLIAGVVDLIVVLDFVFRAVKANNTGFAHYIYRLAGWLTAPFTGIFNNTSTSNGTVLRWGDVLAVAIYTVAAWIITKLVRISATPRTGVNRV